MPAKKENNRVSNLAKKGFAKTFYFTFEDTWIMDKIEQEAKEQRRSESEIVRFALEKHFGIVDEKKK